MCNDEQKKPNAVMKKVEINNGIHLCLFALRSIKVGEEVRYDYGPDDGSMHWRKHTEKKQKCRESVIAQEPETETVTKLKRPEQSDDELAGEKQKDNLITVSSAEAMDTLCLCNKEVIASTRGDELPVSEKHSDELIMAETIGNEEMTVKDTEKKQKCRESVIAQEPETETVTKLKRPEQSDDELAGEKQKDNLITVSSAEAMDTLCLCNKEVIASTRGDELPVSEKHSDELIMAETIGNEEITVKHTEKKQKCRESVIAQEPETVTVTKLKRPEQSDDELAGEKQKDNLITVSSAEAMDTLCLCNKEVIASTRGDELPVSEKHSDELIMAETIGNEEITVKHTEKKQKCRESVIAQEPETETVTKLKRPEQSDDELAGEKQKDNLITVSSAEAMDTLCLCNKEVIASTRGDELPVSEKHSDELIMAETIGNEEITVKHTEKKQKCRESVIAQEPETETVTKLKRPEQSDDELAGEKQKDNLIKVSSAEAMDTLCLHNKEVIASTRGDELPVSEKHSDELIMAETVGNEEMTAKHTEKKQKSKETALKCSAAETIGSEGVALIKVEDSNGRYRPLFNQHNMLRTFNPDSSFSYSIFDEPVSMNRTTKRYTQGKLQKKAGFCECCEYSFENYAKHVNGFQHKMYALTAKNYKGIDEQIADLTIEMFLMKRSSSTRIDIPENQSSNASSISTEQNKTNEQSTIHVEHVEMLQCTRRFTQLVEYSDSTDSRISSNNVVIPHPANALLVEGAENTSENDESSSMISTAQLPADEKHLNNLIMAESKAVETLGNRKVTLEHSENGHKDKETVISSHMNTCFDYIEDSSCSTGSIACLNYSSLTNKLMEKLNKSESCDNDNLLRRKVADRGYLGFEDSEEDVEPDSDAEEGSDSGSLELCCLSDNDLWRKTNNKSKCVESSFKPDQDSSNNDDSILDPDYVPEDISACNSMDSENSDKSLSSEEFPRSKVEKACLKSSNSDHVFCFVPKSLSTISVDTDVNENDDLLLDDNEIRPTVDKGFGEKAENQAVLFEKSGIIPRKKTYDKIHFCTFCGTGIKGKIQRHLLNVHKNETEVAEIRLLPKRDKERSRLLKKLTNEGNFKHNINVLRVGEGKLVVGRRSEIPSKYTVCVYCKKWQSKKNLWRHTKTCVESIEYHKNHPSDETGKKPRILAVKQGQSLINNAVFENNEDNLSQLVYRMRDDEIKEVSMTDPLIRREAGLRMSGLGRQIDQKQDDIYRVSQSARMLGRVLLHAREFKIGISLTELLVPNNFDFVVDIAKKMSTDKDNPALNVGKSLGLLLKKVCDSKYCSALRTCNSQEQLEATNFAKLIETEWNSRVNRTATRRIQNEKRNKIQEVPLTEDLQKFRMYLLKNISELIDRLSKRCNQKDWVMLAKCTMSRLILFNKRRRAEVRELKVDEYLSRPNWKENDCGEMAMALSPTDRMLANRMDMVINAGKSKKNVEAFVLLPPDTRKAIDLLINTRAQVGVPSTNMYIFARLSANTSLAGHTEMQELAKLCEGLQYPERITSRTLRTYIATVSQILDMNTTELENLARHLGHDPKTHKEYYRLSHSTVQLSKVARMLMAVEKGQLHKFRGKSLDNINNEDLPDIDDDLEDTNSVLMPEVGAANPLLVEGVDSTDENDESSNVMATPRGDELLAGEELSDKPIMAETIGYEELTVKHTEKKHKGKETALKRSAAETGIEELAVKHTEKKHKGKETALKLSAAETIGNEDVAVEHTENKNKGIQSAIDGAEKEIVNKLKRPRWSSSELDKLFQIFGPQIARKEMPNGQEIKNFATVIAFSRSEAKIRTQLHNIIHQKVKCHNAH